MDKVCEWFMKNDCRKGINCRFIHDHDLCRDFFFGKCDYGDLCKHYHGGDREKWLKRTYRASKNVVKSKGDRPKHNGTLLLLQDPKISNVELGNERSEDSDVKREKKNDYKRLDIVDRKDSKKDVHLDTKYKKNYTDDHEGRPRKSDKSDKFENRGDGDNRGDRNNKRERTGRDDKGHRTRKAKNTTDFNPDHKPADVRIYMADGQEDKYKNPSNTTETIVDERDVCLIGNMFTQTKPNELYESLLKEINDTGDFDALWKSWHGDSHLIADDKSSIKWKDKCPTFNMVCGNLLFFHK
jgi:hypothetical protein